MRTAWFLASTLAAFVAADASTTTVSVFGIEYDYGYGVGPDAYTSTAARVVAIDKYATTYEIACLSGAPQSACAINSKTPMTLIQGPTTYSYSGEATISTDGAVGVATGIVDCSFTQTSQSVSCSWSFAVTASSSDFTFSTSTSDPSMTIDPDMVSYYALEVTAGLDAFTAGATASASPVKVTSTSTSKAGANAFAKPMITAAPLGAAAVAALAAML